MASDKMNESRSHGRVNSSPSASEFWLPEFGQSRSRPHLRPLDLAASSASSHSAFKIKHSNHNCSPRRASIILTPPLTPSSSFNSASTTSGNDTDTILSTPPESGSPLKWGKLRNSISEHFTTSSDRDRARSISSDIAASNAAKAMAELSTRLGRIDFTDTTPRLEKTFNLQHGEASSSFSNPRGERRFPISSCNDGPSRFLMVRNVPTSVSSHALKEAFTPTGDIKGILVRFQESDGVIIVAYFDIREASRAITYVNGKTISELCFGINTDTNIRLSGQDEQPLVAEPLSPKQLHEVCSTRLVSRNGAIICAHRKEYMTDEPVSFQVAGQSPFIAETNGAFFVTVENRFLPASNLQQVLTSFGEVMSFEALDSDPNNQPPQSPSTDRPRSLSMDPDGREASHYEPNHTPQVTNPNYYPHHYEHLPDPAYQYAAYEHHQSPSGYSSDSYVGMVPPQPTHATNHWTFPLHTPSDYYMPPQGHVYQHSARRTLHTKHSRMHDAELSYQSYGGMQPHAQYVLPVDGTYELSAGGSNEPSEKNQLNLEMIGKGLDTRTTVMVKNIPNKMSDKDLMNFIGRVCPRKIDFLYLRMDFQNGCNVGYAFVNFITVQDLLHFAKTQLGVKWNMYSSEKVLQMSYANY
ncbi:hypothetical protein PHLCEN_2v11945, partial [Hermanssonia centrifuga]